MTCPACGSAKIEKAIMAPQIAGKKGRGRRNRDAVRRRQLEAGSPDRIRRRC